MNLIHLKISMLSTKLQTLLWQYFTKYRWYDWNIINIAHIQNIFYNYICITLITKNNIRYTCNYAGPYNYNKY